VAEPHVELECRHADLERARERLERALRHKTKPTPVGLRVEPTGQATGLSLDDGLPRWCGSTGAIEDASVRCHERATAAEQHDGDRNGGSATTAHPHTMPRLASSCSRLASLVAE
jgi:hypothetical protein